LICDFRPLCQFSIFWLFSKDDHLHFRSVMKYISCYYFSWNMWSFPTWTIWIAHAIQLDNQKQMHACLLWLFYWYDIPTTVKPLLHHHVFSNNDKFSSSIICIYIFLQNLRIFIRIIGRKTCGKIEPNNRVFFPIPISQYTLSWQTDQFVYSLFSNFVANLYQYCVLSHVYLCYTTVLYLLTQAKLY